MSVLALLAPMPTPEQQATTSKLPGFRPRWWYHPGKLDARPVIWSLYNHPEEWRWSMAGYRIEHEPSGHEFRIWGGRRLMSVDCGCSSASGWQFMQVFALAFAMRRWRKWEARRPTSLHQNFASHFIH